MRKTACSREHVELDVSAGLSRLVTFFATSFKIKFYRGIPATSRVGNGFSGAVKLLLGDHGMPHR